MARRRVREPPQAVQALVPRPRWHILPPDAGHLNEVALLAALLPRYRTAARRVPRGRGRPLEWGRLEAAAEWLSREGFDKVSDARDSPCVQSLVRFLDGWREQELTRGVRRGPATRDTAAELAGTLKAIVQRMGWKRGKELTS